jgi:hypothetical protein
MPPPTHSIAAVPTVASNHITRGIAATSIRPNRRVIAPAPGRRAR